MKPTPRISVITPAYNAEKTITETVTSILSQTWKNFEYIIIDDASTDDTWKILQDLKRNDDRIRIEQNTKNLGIAGTRNRGLELAKGEFIAWQDADDISYPDRLEKELQMMESDSDIGIVGGWLEFFDNSGTHSIRTYAEHDKPLRKTIFRYSPVAQPAALIRSKLFKKVGAYDLRYPPAEDLDMSFRLGSISTFANVQEPVIRYRIADTSATFTKLFTLEKNTFLIRLKNIRNPAYRFTVLDFLYNFIQFGILLWLPAKWKIALFTSLRNKTS
jgi:glycosyltransferase involved in cell wall biosynthesis